MEDFIKNLPKIELHAHLNGSLSKETTHELASLLCEQNINSSIYDLSNLQSNFNNLEQCFKKFHLIHQLTKTPRGLQLAAEMVIRDFYKDKVIYLELRSTPKSTDSMSSREYLEILVQTIQDAQRKYDILVKLLVSIDRSKSHRNAEEIVNLAIEMKDKYPDIIKGLDLSGNPNHGDIKPILPLLKKAKNCHLQLALHCAEVDNFAETQEMLDMGFHRLGHGTFLTSQQYEQISKQNITIECCLTSNIKCGTVRSYQAHHFPILYYENICNVVLCTDDSGIFDTTLTQEITKAYAYYNLKKDDIYKLSINAIEAAFANVEDKYEMKQKVKAYFNESV